MLGEPPLCRNDTISKLNFWSALFMILCGTLTNVAIAL